MTGCTQSCAIHCPAPKPPPQTPVAPSPQPAPPATGAATSVRRLGLAFAMAVVAILGACPWAAAPRGLLSRPKGPGLRSEYYLLPSNATASDLERATAAPGELAAQLRYDLGDLRETVCAAAACVQMGPEEGLLAWLQHILPRPCGSLSLWGLTLLKRMGLLHADATSLLHLLRRDGPELFLLSGPQWGALLEAGGLGHRGSALDVGAGAGDITAVLGPLFRDPPVATEVGFVSVLRLRLAGVAAVQTPAPTVASVGGRFDAVFLLNVLDRARRPPLRKDTDLVPPPPPCYNPLSTEASVTRR